MAARDMLARIFLAGRSPEEQQARILRQRQQSGMMDNDTDERGGRADMDADDPMKTGAIPAQPGGGAPVPIPTPRPSQFALPQEGPIPMPRPGPLQNGPIGSIGGPLNAPIGSIGGPQNAPIPPPPGPEMGGMVNPLQGIGMGGMVNPQQGIPPEALSRLVGRDDRAPVDMPTQRVDRAHRKAKTAEGQKKFRAKAAQYSLNRR